MQDRHSEWNVQLTNTSLVAQIMLSIPAIFLTMFTYKQELFQSKTLLFAQPNAAQGQEDGVIFQK